LPGTERRNIHGTAIALISETGANLHSVTFDGTTLNMRMVKSLGEILILITKWHTF